MHFNGYLGLFFALFLEMIGIPFPGETILTLSGIEWVQGDLSLLPLILSVLAGNIIGSSISYFIGRYFGRRVILNFGKYVGITENKLNAAEKNFNKYQVLVVLFGKFIAGIRVLAAYLAGINRMNFWKFSLYNALGSFLWVFVFVFFGRYVNVFWKHYHQNFHYFLFPALTLLLISIIMFFYKKTRR